MLFIENNCDSVLMKYCHICRWFLAVFNLLGVPDGCGLQHQDNSESVRQVHDHRTIYSNFQRLLLSAFILPTIFIWCKNKHQIFPDAKKLKVKLKTWTVLVQIYFIIHAHTLNT